MQYSVSELHNMVDLGSVLSSQLIEYMRMYSGNFYFYMVLYIYKYTLYAGSNNNHLCIFQGYEYSRSGNPTRDCLEKCIASIEGGKHGRITDCKCERKKYFIYIYHMYLSLSIKCN